MNFKLLVLHLLLFQIDSSEGFFWRKKCAGLNCIVEEWSPWTTCSLPCGAVGISKSTKRIIRHPSCGGIGCPPTERSRPCNRNCGQGHLQGGVCKCNPGWTGHCCQSDVNECLNGNPCPQNCQNTIGSYKCSCKPGYKKLESGQCEDINECLEGWCDQKCINTIGSVNCTCDKPGYILSQDLRTCQVDNKCLVQHDCDQICIKKSIGYECKCKSGFYMTAPSKKCYDVDECALNQHHCHQICINIEGSFKCKCKQGFQTYNEGRNCTDIDECRMENVNCQFSCENYPGGYNCTCPPGLMLNNDGKTCSDIDECSSQVNVSNCPLCNNIYGSFYCSCKKGYLRTQNGSCEEFAQKINNVNKDDGKYSLKLWIACGIIVVTLLIITIVCIKYCKCRKGPATVVYNMVKN